MSDRLLYVVVCGAGPAAQVGQLITQAHQRGWRVQVIATPAALDFIDTDELATQTGHPVRSAYRRPGEPRSRPADAIILAPATFNTINKLAAGISDTYALGVLNEAIGMGIPVVILPFVNTALAGRASFRRSVEHLRAENVHVLIGPGAFEPHEPHTGDGRLDDYPWKAALDTAEQRRGLLN